MVRKLERPRRFEAISLAKQPTDWRTDHPDKYILAYSQLAVFSRSSSFLVLSCSSSLGIALHVCLNDDDNDGPVMQSMLAAWDRHRLDTHPSTGKKEQGRQSVVSPRIWRRRRRRYDFRINVTNEKETDTYRNSTCRWADRKAGRGWLQASGRIAIGCTCKCAGECSTSCQSRSLWWN